MVVMMMVMMMMKQGWKKRSVSVEEAGWVV
jgi:hypothetical protein